MSPTLEQRRRAIVEALRSIMAEPLDPIPVNAELASPSPAAAREPEPYPETETETQTENPGPTAPVVPPLKSLGAMSPTASRALFGHD